MPVLLNPDPTDPANQIVRWTSETQMSFDVEPTEKLAVGIYDVTVTNADGKSASRPRSLAIVAPPKVDAVVPMNVCVAQGERMVEVKGSGFLTVDGMAPTVEVDDANGVLVEG
ncbi:MAG: hypothetical protein ABI321_05150, partial [Polyangia bacterium]